MHLNVVSFLRPSMSEGKFKLSGLLVRGIALSPVQSPPPPWFSPSYIKRPKWDICEISISMRAVLATLLFVTTIVLSSLQEKWDFAVTGQTQVFVCSCSKSNHNGLCWLSTNWKNTFLSLAYMHAY